MSRKRTQAEKIVESDDDEEVPVKRTKRPKKANKENAPNPNIPLNGLPSNEELEAMTQSGAGPSSVVFRNMQGNVELKSGRLKKIVLKNFMCHRNFEVHLNPNVNVFVGLNGSGKSAILTAIAIGLGSNAKATARSTNLKDLVRRGETTATIEITLSNDGVDSYDGDIYGKEIVIIRTINGNTGASQYKIKSENGKKIISSSRNDLAKLTLCMNIQVENPVLILNQDAARSFLKECDPKKLYAFFMKATQVESIIEKLNATLKIAVTLKNNLEIMDKRLKHEEIEILDLQAKLTRLQSVVTLRQFIVSLQNEIEWLHIIQKEKELMKAQTMLSKTREELKQIEDFIKNQAKYEKETKDLICQLGAKFEEYQQEIAQKVSLFEKARSEYEAEASREKEMDNKVNEGIKKVAHRLKNIRDAENDIAEHENNPENLNNMRRENEEKISNYEKQCAEAKIILENAKRDYGMFVDNLNVSKERASECSNRIQREQNQLQKLQNQTEQYKRAGKDKMHAYGASMSSLLKDIQDLHRRNRFSAMPRGPIGRFIEVTDPKYRSAAENIIDRHTLTSFIVNSDQDRMLLRRTIQKYNDLQSTSIIYSKFQDAVYNVQGGRVKINPNVGVVLMDVLKVSDAVVMNCLIDQKQVERIVLVENTDNAIRLTQDVQNVPQNLFKIILLNPFSEYYPAPNYKTYSLRQQPNRFIQANVDELIQNNEHQVQSVQAKIAHLRSEMTQYNKECKDHEKLANDKKRIMTELNQKISKCTRELDDLRAIEYPEEDDIELKRQILEEEKKNLQQLEEKLKPMREKQKTFKEITQNAKKRMDQAQQDHDKTREKMSKVQETIETSKIELNEMKSDKSNKKNQLDINKANETQQVAAVTKLQGEVNAMMQQTTAPRVECKRPEDEIKSQIKSVEKKIERIESNHENIDDIAKLLEDKTTALNEQKSITEGLERIRKTLEKMRNERFSYVRKLRQTMILKVRHKFSQLMEIRSYTAEIEVDTKEKTLELKVIPRDAAIEGAVSNTKSLSGGERSYSTVSFLIALWSCVDHPFYFLDEYDVFSDELNRAMMTRLLFNEASKNPSKQYGFLTPQDFSNIQASDTITIHKLQDPDRNQ